MTARQGNENGNDGNGNLNMKSVSALSGASNKENAAPSSTAVTVNPTNPNLSKVEDNIKLAQTIVSNIANGIVEETKVDPAVAANSSNNVATTAAGTGTTLALTQESNDSQNELQVDAQAQSELIANALKLDDEIKTNGDFNSNITFGSNNTQFNMTAARSQPEVRQDMQQHELHAQSHAQSHPQTAPIMQNQNMFSDSRSFNHGQAMSSQQHQHEQHQQHLLQEQPHSANVGNVGNMHNLNNLNNLNNLHNMNNSNNGMSNQFNGGVNNYGNNMGANNGYYGQNLIKQENRV